MVDEEKKSSFRSFALTDLGSKDKEAEGKVSELG